MTNKPPTKANLLKTIYAGRKQFDLLMTSLTEMQLTTPGLHGGWAVKDCLAHLAAWERLTLERLNSGLLKIPARISPIKTEDDVALMNEKVYAIHRDRPLADILDDFQHSFQRLMARVEEIDKKILEKPIPLEWAGDRPVWELIADNTYLHYEEHQTAIEKWLERQKNWSIREEAPEDRPGIRRVEELAFGRPDEANLVDGIRARGGMTLSLVAIEGEEVVGHVFFSPVTITEGEMVVEGVGLGPVAVLPSHQKLGVGAALCHAGLVALAQRGHAIAVVLGHPDYYPRFGFKSAEEYEIRGKWDVSPGVFMVKELQPEALEGVKGLVQYAPEFG